MRIEPAARCIDLVKTYRTATGEVRALAGVTATFPRGALTAVVGPSGSGKSSLLRLLAGIDRPTSGTVRVGEVDVGRSSQRASRRLRQRSVGYVFQRPSDNFLSYLTVGEHLRLALRRDGEGLADPERLLQELGLGGRFKHLPGELSGGEQQRAAFAAVIATDADVVVADEPTAELDSRSASILLTKLRALLETGLTFVLATHDPGVVRKADHVLELDHGVLKADRKGAHRAAPAARATAWRPHASVRSPARPTPLSACGDREPASATRLVRIDCVGKTYRRGVEVVHALREASLTLGEGEVVGLVGPSGSGKTTLLNLIAGWEHPDAGRIVWYPQAQEAPGARTLLLPWAQVAVIPQRLGLVEELSVRENVEFPARLAGVLSERVEAADELIDGLGLGHLQKRQPKETSVGEQQRTALARALVLSPRLVLADEPTGHQDKGWTEKVFQELARAADAGTACLVATHNKEVISSLDRIVSMADGQLSEGEALQETRTDEGAPGR